MRRLVTLTLLLLLGQSISADRLLPGRVIRVIDGDSLILDVRGAHYRVDLDGIDAPELNQPWGDTAAQALHRNLTGAFVVVSHRTPADGDGLLGGIAHRGRDIALDLLSDGLAWALPDSRVTQAEAYAAAQRQAREDRRGLWSDPDPVAPWEWRTAQAR